MPAYYRNCYQYSENNQKQLSMDTVIQKINSIKNYLSSRGSYLVTLDDVADNDASLQKLQQKEDFFKEIHAACIALIDRINGSYDEDNNSQNETLDYLVANFSVSSIEEAKNQLLLLTGEIEQNLYLIEQARFIEQNQLDLEEVNYNNDAKKMATGNRIIDFWNASSTSESRKEILAGNHKKILTFINIADESVRTPTGNIKAIGALLGNEQVSSNYAPYSLKRAKYEVPQPCQPMNFIYHGTLETIKETLVAYFNAIKVARNIPLVSIASNQEITFQNMGSFLRSTEYQNMFTQLRGTELCKSDGFSPCLDDGNDNNVAIALFETKQAKMMDIYACLQVLIEALDGAVRTGIGENDIRAIFDSHFCDLVECNFTALRNTLFLMLRKIGYTLYHIKQAIFFERMQAAVVTKNRAVESAKEYHAPIHFLNLADTADTDIKMANAITAYNHQAIQNYLDFFTKSIQSENKKLFSFRSTPQNSQPTARKDDSFFLEALNSLNNIENVGELSSQYKIEYEAGKYKEDFRQFADLINAYPKPGQFTILQEPHYAEPKLQPAILNLPEEPQTENIAPSMPLNTLHESSWAVNISDAASLIAQYEQAKETSQQSVSTLTRGDTSKTVNEHSLTQERLSESLYPIIKYHVIPINCWGNAGTLEIISQKITLLTSLQHAYYHFLLILSDVKKNLANNNPDLTMDFRQAFPELIEILEGASTGSNVEDKCEAMLIVLKKTDLELMQKLHLIEGRLYIAMQARYVEQIKASVNATKGIKNKNGEAIITLFSSQAVEILKAAQKQPLQFSPVDDRGLDSIIKDNSNNITLYYDAIEKLLNKLDHAKRREFREKIAQHGLTHVLMLGEEDLSIPVDQNTIYLQQKNDYLTAYWIKENEVKYQSFLQAEMPNNINALLPSTGESSDNKELIEAIRVKFNCTKYGSSHPESNPSLFVTIDKASAKSLSLLQNNSSMSTNAYQACINQIPLYVDIAKKSALEQIKAYSHDIRDFLRDNSEIGALQQQDESDEKTFSAILNLFISLTKYLSHLNNPNKNNDKTPEEHVEGILKHINTLKNICVHDNSKSQVAMVAYNQFLNFFNQLIDELDKKESNAEHNGLTRAFSRAGINVFAKSEENPKLKELLQNLKNNPFPSKEYTSETPQTIHSGP